MWLNIYGTYVIQELVFVTNRKLKFKIQALILNLCNINLEINWMKNSFTNFY